MSTAARMWALGAILFGLQGTVSAISLPAVSLSPLDTPAAAPQVAALPEIPHTASSVLLFTDLPDVGDLTGLNAPAESSLPEPASAGLLCLGLAAVASRFRRPSRRYSII